MFPKIASKYALWVLPIIAATYAFWFSYARGPDLNWDLLNYHYFMGYAVFEGRLGYDVAPADLQSFLNPYWNVVNYLANSTLGFPWNGWALLIIQLLSLPALVGICRELEHSFGFTNSSVESLVSLGLCLVSPLWWSELGTTFFSSSTAPFVLYGLWLTIRAVSEPERPASSAFLLLAGVLTGLATGLKLTNAIFLVALPFCLTPVLISGRVARSLSLGIYFAMGAMVGFGITAPWNFFLWEEWQSPMYPFYNKVFNSQYFEVINWRDVRWKFNSPNDFLMFAGEAWNLTGRTSEIAFADRRIFLVVLLGATALLARLQPAEQRYNHATKRHSGAAPAALLWFACVAFGLWATLFAYQRYLIPVELIGGFAIWILARRVFRRDVVVPAMVLMLGISLLGIHVPDWGHDKSLRGSGAARFGLEVPSELSTSPAIYLLSGKPTSYVLPFLHPGSRFLRVDPSVPLRLEERVREALNNSAGLPVRILLFEAEISRLNDVARKFGDTDLDDASWRCDRFRSAVHRFAACEIDSGSSGRGKVQRVTIDFKAGQRLPPEVLWVTGLSAEEPWGRWSDSDEVTVQFGRCLPEGPLTVGIEGHAFGPNVGRPVFVGIGGAESQIVLSAEPRLVTALLDGGATCRKQLSLKVPEKISPFELGLSGDRRQLGIGIAKLSVDPAQSSDDGPQ